MSYLFEVRVSKERGGVPHKVVSVKDILDKLDEGGDFTHGGFTKTKNLVTKKCAFCKKDFRAAHQRMKFCVKENVPLKNQCRSKAEAKKRVAQKSPLPLAKCALCEKEFQPIRDSHIFCNKPCHPGMARMNVNRKKVYKCKSCKKEFSTDKKNAFVYCGNPCSYVLAYNEKLRQKTLDRHKNQKCQLCGEIIVGAKRPRVLCNSPCRMTKAVQKTLRLKAKSL